MKRGVREGHHLVLHAGAASAQTLAWIRVNARGEPDGQRGESSPEELAARFPGDTFHLLVPMADVTVHCVRLPGRHNAAGMRALPWLLEDKLAVAADSMTLVPLASAGENVWVAGVASARLAQWTAPFTAAGVALCRVIPDALALPLSGDGISALRWDNRWLLRTGQWQGAEVEPDWLPLWYAAWQNEHPDAVNVNCYGKPPADMPQWRSSPEADPLALLAYGAVRQTLSLLPQAAAPRRFAWRAPLSAAVAVLVLLFAQQVVTWRQLANQAEALHQQLQPHFPGKTEADWRNALRRGNHGELSSWLSALPALPQGVTIEQLRYGAAPPQLQLRLRGEAAQVGRARQALAAAFVVQPAEDGVLMLTQKKEQL